MREVVLPRIGTVAAWRREARTLARAGVPAEAVLWRRGGASADLFAQGAPAVAGPAREITLTKAAIDGIESALCHSDPERFARAYRTVLRIAEGRAVWGDRNDRDIGKLLAQAKAVGRDIHKMHAFVRFREVAATGPRRAFAAWFEPEHPCLERGAPFFAKRFGDMDWVIATPDLTARFEGGALSYEETTATARPPADATEDLWRTYYASIFNPARVMVKAMCAEMPKKYWKNLPEADLIPGLIEGAEARVRAMADTMPQLEPDRRARALSDHAARVLARPAPEGPVATLAEELRGCTRCDLCRHATQAVPGQGPVDARLMIVGEQPGDREDLTGTPFVGPAGQVFERAAAQAGMARTEVFVTNAVKHFKFQARGKRRIHQRPDAGEVEACRWWLDLERALIRPRLVVAMGATAAQALTGSGRDLAGRRGRIETGSDGTPVLITWHPSFILRTQDAGIRARAEAQLAADLTIARQWHDAGGHGAGMSGDAPAA